MLKLDSSQLRKTYKLKDVCGVSRMEAKHRKAIIGQDRAVKALKFGLGNRAPGFNVYVSAPHGEEKIEVIRHFLKGLAEKDPLPSDWCYVNNFKDNYCPIALKLPQGLAFEFKTDMESFIGEAREALVKALESEEFGREQDEIKQELARSQQEIFNEIQEEANKINFLIKSSPMEIVAMPMVGDQPMSTEQFKALSKEERDEIQTKQAGFQKILESTIRKSRDLEKAAREKLIALERKAALFAMEGLLAELLAKYESIPRMKAYMEDMKTNILDNLPSFLKNNQTRKTQNTTLTPSTIEQLYQVNVLVDNKELQHSPIIVELNPTFNNLFGKIERESVMGTLVTDFTLIRPGALHHANGGYLIMPVEDLLRVPFSYDQLKRSLRNRCIDIEDPTERYGFISAKSLKPEPVPLDVQVILIGRNYLMQLLYMYDDDFRNLFKVKAEFDSVMPALESNVKELCGFINAFCEEETLLPPSQSSLVKMVEYGHRLANHQDKISTQLEDLTDLVREANYYAVEAGEQFITEQHIQQAIQEKTYRSNLIQEKIEELIEANTIFVDLKGEKIGQINGLSVLDVGDYAFGRPTRITASTSVGNKGIVDIEREVKMGGPIHSKGVMILTGYLFEKFGRDKPLNVSAHIVFEQSYSGVEGDSASSAELYAILSSLAEVPLKQNIAVTGSVNQKGEIQAVGGINEKIEGYFEVCQRAGLENGQGVLIPKANTKNLMLKEAVIEAVRDEVFHIWAVDTIEEGLEILSGIPAGNVKWNEESCSLEIDKDSVYHRANKRLWDMSKIIKEFGKVENGEEIKV